MWVGEISVFFKSNISEICLKMKINPPPGNIFRKTFLNWNFSLLISWLEKISIVGSHIFLRHVISTTTWRKKKKNGSLNLFMNWKSVLTTFWAQEDFIEVWKNSLLWVAPQINLFEFFAVVIILFCEKMDFSMDPSSVVILRSCSGHHGIQKNKKISKNTFFSLKKFK